MISKKNASEELRDLGKRSAGPIAPELRSSILQAISAGRRAVDVALEYGVHYTTISRWKAEERQRNGQSEQRSVSTPAPAKPEPQPTARDTGRYSKSFKDEVLAQVSSGRKVVEVAGQYELPPGTIGRWKREAATAGGELPAPKSTRPTSSGPSPIDPQHRQLVLDLKGQHVNMGLAQLQNQLKRFEGVKLGRGIIARILADAGIRLQKPKRRSDSKPAENRFEMTRPNELWAVDFKEFWIHSEKAFALFVLDDFSRFCLGYAMTQKPTAELAIDTVQTAIQRYGRPERVLSDRGPQFYAWNGVSRFDEFLAEFLTDHTVTKAGHPFTNGKIEAFNRSLQTEILDVEEFATLADADAAFSRHVTRYNFSRTHMGIDGLVPADRYFGLVEEAQRALETGLEHAGPGLRWLSGLLSHDGPALRPPEVLQLVVRDGKLELVVLGRRFMMG